MTRAPFRLFRTGLIGSIIFGLAAGGHLVSGGSLPEPLILSALCALTLVPVAVLTRFRLSLPVLAGLLGAAQAWLHWSFCALSAAPMASPSPAHAHAGHAAAALAPELLGSSTADPSAAVDWMMFTAHVVATFVTSLLLARGEKALAALASWLRPLVRLPEPCTCSHVRIRLFSLVGRDLPVDRPGRRFPTRRGPPAFVPAA
ncbi:hypothetical protein J7E83_14875 [Arthrobacter sp. ISL-48]|nr:hypothetical protein [Arthrobacter sp. ISL-48]